MNKGNAKWFVRLVWTSGRERERQESGIVCQSQELNILTRKS